MGSPTWTGSDELRESKRRSVFVIHLPFVSHRDSFRAVDHILSTGRRISCQLLRGINKGYCRHYPPPLSFSIRIKCFYILNYHWLTMASRLNCLKDFEYFFGTTLGKGITREGGGVLCSWWTIETAIPQRKKKKIRFWITNPPVLLQNQCRYFSFHNPEGDGVLLK